MICFAAMLLLFLQKVCDLADFAASTCSNRTDKATGQTSEKLRVLAEAGLVDGKIPRCEGHRFTVTLRGLSNKQLSMGLFDERLEACLACCTCQWFLIGF